MQPTFLCWLSRTWARALLGLTIRVNHQARALASAVLPSSDRQLMAASNRSVHLRLNTVKGDGKECEACIGHGGALSKYPCTVCLCPHEANFITDAMQSNRDGDEQRSADIGPNHRPLVSRPAPKLTCQQPPAGVV